MLACIIEQFCTENMCFLQFCVAIEIGYRELVCANFLNKWQDLFRNFESFSSVSLRYVEIY